MSRTNPIFCGFSLIVIILVGQMAMATTLTVVNGSGSGEYPVESVVHIWANPYEDDDPDLTTSELTTPQIPIKIFDCWVGDTSALDDVFAAHTTATIPASDFTVTAHYAYAPRWAPARVISHFPSSHIGVIFLFHGMGGGAASFFSESEKASFTLAAMSQGYAVVAMESFDRVTSQWSSDETAAENVDLQRVAAARLDFIAQGRMAETDPVYLVGISNGGQFASRFDQVAQAVLGFPIAATALYNSAGELSVMQTTTVPTIFLLAENDSVSSSSTALMAHNYLIDNGVPSQYCVNPASPLYPERFWRVEGLSANDSQFIFNALNNGGCLDANGFLIDNPFYSPWESLIPVEYEFYLPEICKQLLVAYAEHQFMGEFNQRTLDFFANPVSIIENAPEIAEFTPTSGSPGIIVNIFGANFFDIEDVRFNGLSAVFDVVSAMRIKAAVPDGVSTGPIQVINSIGTGVSETDFIVNGPAVDSFDPTQGGPGTRVTINGTGFGGLIAVRLNGVHAPILGSTLSIIVVTVPFGATTGPIEVETSAGIGQSTADFVIGPPPAITDFSPTSGPCGTQVQIYGSGFSETTSVKLRGSPINFVVDSDNQITATVPLGAQNGYIRVATLFGVTMSQERFIVELP